MVRMKESSSAVGLDASRIEISFGPTSERDISKVVDGDELTCLRAVVDPSCCCFMEGDPKSMRWTTSECESSYGMGDPSDCVCIAFLAFLMDR